MKIIIIQMLCPKFVYNSSSGNNSGGNKDCRYVLDYLKSVALYIKYYMVKCCYNHRRLFERKLNL